MDFVVWILLKTDKVNTPTGVMKKIHFLLCKMLFVNSLVWAAPMQSVPDMQNAVLDFVQSSLDPAGDYQITQAQIDSRLQLPACQQALEVYSQSGDIRPGRNTLGIRCNGLEQWTIYSTVLVKSNVKVLVTTRPLNRNETIKPEQLTVETRDVAGLQPGFVTDPAAVFNKQAIRFIPAGSVLYSMHMTEPMLIRRGERVNIQTGKPGMLISSVGVAMMDGIKGQKISVKNVSSNRVIQGTVTNAGLVSVFF